MQNKYAETLLTVWMTKLSMSMYNSSSSRKGRKQWHPQDHSEDIFECVPTHPPSKRENPSFSRFFSKISAFLFLFTPKSVQENTQKVGSIVVVVRRIWFIASLSSSMIFWGPTHFGLQCKWKFNALCRILMLVVHDII